MKRWAWASMVAATIGGLTTIGCGGGANPTANDGQPGQPAVPAVAQGNPAAAGPATPAAPPVALTSPQRVAPELAVLTLKRFLFAMVQKDKATIEQLTYDSNGREVLWHGEAPLPEFVVDAKREVDSITFHRVLPNDEVVQLDGSKLTIKEGDLKPNQTMLTFPENPIPFFLEEENGVWLVHADPIIALRKVALEEAAAAAAEAAQLNSQTVQQPGVTPADQLGRPGFAPAPGAQQPGTQPGAFQPGASPPGFAPGAAQPIAQPGFNGPPPSYQPGPAQPIQPGAAQPIQNQPPSQIGTRPITPAR